MEEPRKLREASFFMLFPRFFPCRNDPSARRVFLPAKAPLVSQGELSATRMTEGIKPPVFHRTFFPALAVPSTALPGRNQRETAHGFSLSLRVRVHRERGSRNTLSLCASLVTFSASRKSPHGVTGSWSLRKPDQNAPQSNRQCDTATTPPSKPHPGHAPHPLVISPAGHSS